MTKREGVWGASREPARPAAEDWSWDIGPWSLGAAHCALLTTGIFLVLGLIYSLATPILEASDEFKHYPYVQHVQTERRLPVLEPEVCERSPAECPWLQDGAQPPGYYVLMAAATSWIDTSDLSEVLWKNKHAFIGNPTQVCNKNLIIHQPEREQWPWTGSVLAVHVIRLLTLFFGAGTVFLTYLLARELFPGRPGLAVGASALTAFNPMLLFVSTSVNNDALAALLGSLAIVVMVRISDDESAASGAKFTLQTGLLGLLIGLAVLTKLSLLGLIPLAVLVAGVRAWHRDAHLPLRPRFASALVHVMLIVAVVVAVSGWWFLRNWRTYGDPTGLNAFIAVQGRRAQAPTIQDWMGEFGTFRWTYWGLFGGVNVMAPRSTYWFYDLLSLAGVVGFAIWAVRRWKRGNTHSDLQVLLPPLWAFILFISVLRWTWISPAFQGRLMFPGIAGISTLLALGLRQWLAERIRDTVSLGGGVCLLLIAALLPFIAIRPAYARPQPLTMDEVPDAVRVEPLDVGGVARVVGVALERQSVDPDRERAFVDVTIYWEAARPDSRAYVSFVRLLGHEYELAGQINRHPACGMVPTSLWERGQVWRDPYHIPVDEDATAPSRLRLEAGLYDPEARSTLGAVQVGQAKLAPPDAPASSHHLLDMKLADGITLRGYDLTPESVSGGKTVTVTLQWQARDDPSRDYQVFIHLVGDDSNPLVQSDGPPVMGNYPTSLWAKGETVADPHAITLPAQLQPGQYRLLVGMYDLETMKRLSRFDGDGGSVELPLTVTAE